MLAAKSNLPCTLGTAWHCRSQQHAVKVASNLEAGEWLEQVGDWSRWSSQCFTWVLVPESEGWTPLAITDLEPASE